MEQHNAYLPGSFIIAELAQEVDLLHKLPLIEAQVEDSASQDPVSMLYKQVRS